MFFWRIFWLLTCFSLIIVNSHADRAKQKIAVVLGDLQSLHSQTLLNSLNKKRFKYQIYSLKQLEVLPYKEIFDQYIDSSVLRIIDQKDSYSFMSLEEADFWANFLGNRGSLTLFADTLSQDIKVYNSTLMNYVGFKTNRLGTKVKDLIGSKKDLIAKGQKLSVDQSKFRDNIIPNADSGIDVVYQSQNSIVTGIKQQTCNFRMSYFTFLPGEIKDAQTRHNFIERTLDWTLGYALTTGMQAPDFNILLSDGTPTGIYNKYNQLNSIVVVEFMATWCSSCEKQLPKMVALHKEFQEKDVSFIFVSYKESLDIVQKYLENHPEITWPVAITPDGLGALRYGVKGLPELFILDSNRKVRFIHKGLAKQQLLKKNITTLLRDSNFKFLYKSPNTHLRVQ